MSPATRVILPLLALLLPLGACQSGPETPPPQQAADKPAAAVFVPPPLQSSPADIQQQLSPQPALPPHKAATTPAQAHPAEEAPPGAVAPTPPLRETFDGQPQLSLFPRVATYRPEDDDAQGLGFWNAYIDHILRTSGMSDKIGRNGTRGWMVRSLDTLDSVAFFSPVAVKPDTTYRISFDFMGDLPAGISAGLGVLEFDRFLWIGDQYTASLCKNYLVKSHDGSKFSGQQAWGTHSFTVRTTPASRMIHLILFCDGRNDKNGRAFFDNLVIEEIPAKGKRG